MQGAFTSSSEGTGSAGQTLFMRMFESNDDNNDSGDNNILNMFQLQ